MITDAYAELATEVGEAIQKVSLNCPTCLNGQTSKQLFKRPAEGWALDVEPASKRQRVELPQETTVANPFRKITRPMTHDRSAPKPAGLSARRSLFTRPACRSDVPALHSSPCSVPVLDLQARVRSETAGCVCRKHLLCSYCLK